MKPTLALPITLWLAVAPACGAPPVTAPTAELPPRPIAIASTSTAASAAPAPAPEPPDAPVVFVEDDYPRALAEARARHLPLFIDTWATWCHTCLSMKSYVFPDPALRRFGARFVWLSLDTEREGNAPVVNRLAVRVLPTLYVVDPATEQPVLAWPGSLTTPELAMLLEDVDVASAHGGPGAAKATAALVRGRQATASGHGEEAIVAYREALTSAPDGWSRRPQAVDALVTALADAKQLADCASTAAIEAPRLPAGTALADVLRTAIGCAGDLPREAPERERLESFVVLGVKLVSDPSPPILADDRSDLYDYVVHALQELGHKDEASRVARAWAAFLESQAASAPSPTARAVFDAHRLLAYVAIGTPERAIPMLEQSERDFPDDYNPPARLATAYLKLRRFDDALAAVHRALGRAYGPRKLRLWSLEADIFEARKDRGAARRALGEGLAFAKTIPLTGGYPKLRDALEKRLAALK